MSGLNLIRAVGIDADDTLWHNETIFEASHRRFCELLSHHHPADTVERALYEVEMANLEHFGYGIKGFALSAIETAVKLTEGRISGEEIAEILAVAKSMVAHPVELLDGVRETLEALRPHFPLILITKGDLRDQERKLERSGLADLFAGVSIVSEKTVTAYRRVVETCGVAPEQFLMIGNSPKSDILPVIELGGHAVHVPYHLTWEHEQADDARLDHPRVHRVVSVREVPGLLGLNGAEGKPS
ncbi:MAG: HAD family hydrolase [Puniceicoccaceae bacterium]|nr:MAG: HAD family hydrolase [Puniceicoccaceae bacterium]